MKTIDATRTALITSALALAAAPATTVWAQGVIGPQASGNASEGIARCGCGGGAVAARFGCLDCGASCCAACAIALESVAYCGDCAVALLDPIAAPKSGSFELY